MTGVKHDENKIRLELISSEFIFAVGEILTFGAKKYADRNWEDGLDYSRVFGACMRHLWSWWAGKSPTCRNFLFGTFDDETNFSHLWHAACCLMFLVTYEERRLGDYDDRPTGKAPGAKE